MINENEKLLPAEISFLEKVNKGQEKISLYSNEDEFDIHEELDSNVIRADFLRNIFVNLLDKKLKAIEIAGAIIKGKMGLEIWNVEFNLTFIYCNFKDGLIIKDSKLRKLLLIGCISKQIYIEKSVIFGHFAFTGMGEKQYGFCPGGLICKDVEFKSTVAIAYSKFSAQMLEDEYEEKTNSDASLEFTRCSINGNLRIQDVFGFGRVNFHSSKLSGEIVINNSLIGNPLREASIDARFFEVEKGFFIENSFLWGKLRLNQCQFGGQTNLQGYFIPSVQLDQDNSVYNDDYPLGLRNDHCVISGVNSNFAQLSIENSEIAGYLNFRNANIENDFRIESCLITNNYTDIIAKVISFINKFNNNEQENSSSEESSENITIVSSGLYCSFSKVGGVLGLHSISKSDDFFLDLDYAQLHIISDDKSGWPNSGLLSIIGLTFNGFISKIPLKERMKWLDLQLKESYTPEPFQHMANFFKSKGMLKEAVEVSMKRTKIRSKFSPRISRFFYWISRYTIGNGYKPYRSLYWAVGFIVISAFVFSWGKFAIVSKTDKILIDQFNSIIFSIDTFLPVIDFDHSTNFRIELQKDRQFQSQIIRVYYWFHIAVGWFLSTIAVLGFSGVVK